MLVDVKKIWLIGPESAERFSEYLITIIDIFFDAREYFKTILLIKNVKDYSWKLRISDDEFVDIQKVILMSRIMFKYAKKATNM